MTLKDMTLKILSANLEYKPTGDIIIDVPLSKELFNLLLMLDDYFGADQTVDSIKKILFSNCEK